MENPLIQTSLPRLPRQGGSTMLQRRMSYKWRPEIESLVCRRPTIKRSVPEVTIRLKQSRKWPTNDMINKPPLQRHMSEVSPISLIERKRGSVISSILRRNKSDLEREIKLQQAKRKKYGLLKRRRGQNDLGDYDATKEKPIEIWKRKIRIVRMLCGVCMTFRRYATEAGLISSLIVPVRNRSHISARGDTLDFIVSDYRVQKEIPVPLSTIELMEKPTLLRTEDDIQAIARCMRAMPSFRKYTTEMQLMMSKIVRYMRCEKRRVVLRKGHIGFSVYFIYSGSVSVVMDTEGDTVLVNPEVVILRRGACFGEIALLQNTRRNATIVTAEECEFLVVDKADFIENGIDVLMNDEFKFRVNFFSNWPSLADWTEDDIRALAYTSRSEDFNHDKIIIKNSRKNEWLWFIVKGTCEVLKLVNLETYPDELKSIKTLPCGTDRYLASSTPREASQAQSRRLSRHRWKVPLHDSKRPSNNVPLIRVGSQLDTTVETDESEHEPTAEDARSHASELVPPLPQSSLSINLDAREEHSAHSNPPKENTFIYAKVDRLRDGMCFGLQTLFEHDDIDRNTTDQYSLISKGCSVIHVPKKRFLELATAQSLNRIRAKNLLEYPSELELVHKFVSHSIWDAYKQGLVEEIVMHRTTPKPLRDNTLEKYMEKKEYMRMHDGYGTGALSFGEPTTTKQVKQRLKSAKESVRRSELAHAEANDSTNNLSTLSSNSEAELILASRVQRRAYRPLTCPPLAAAKRERLKMVLHARAQEREKWSTKTRKNVGETEDSRSVRRAQSAVPHRPPISLRLNSSNRNVHAMSSPKSSPSQTSIRNLKSSSFTARGSSVSACTSNVSFQSSSAVWSNSTGVNTPSYFKSSSDGFGVADPKTRAKSAVVRRHYVSTESCKTRESRLKSKSSLFA